MHELIEKIEKSLEIMQVGTMNEVWTKDGYKECRCRAERGIGTKAYTIRRIEILQDMLKELKKDIKDGKYDFKG